MSRPRRREAPVRRINPSGRPVWLARFTNAQGRRKSTGTYSTKREAQQAIDEAYGRRERVDTLGDYFKRWPQLHPRAARTQATNEHRITRVLAVELEGVRLEDWPLADLRRRHAHELVDVMLRHQGRAAAGAQNILRALSAMAEDAITDEAAELNAFRGVTVRQSDPRVRKAPKRPRVFSWAEMHHFADACGQHETMVRLLADCGLRLGELLPLARADVVRGDCSRSGCEVPGPHLHVERSAHEGVVLEGTKHDHDTLNPGRVVPLSAGTLALIGRTPPRLATQLLFPTPTGCLWRDRNFYRDVWVPGRRRTGMTIRPHEMRHSWITHLRAAAVNDADLAEMAGHSVETMLGRYSHALGRSFDTARRAIGG